MRQEEIINGCTRLINEASEDYKAGLHDQSNMVLLRLRILLDENLAKQKPVPEPNPEAPAGHGD